MPLLESLTIGGHSLHIEGLPRPLQVDPALGLVVARGVSGSVVHTARWPERGLYECRATPTPGGDWLLMFPDGGHYAQTDRKVNDMLAYRSSDRGSTWHGPIVAFDIDYNQHGFVPLTPASGTRIYAFGTQPVWGMCRRERGLAENAPIGFRYSDDDGRTWSEVRLIRPVNDPDFTGMSVMRMCETASGAWLIGAHEGDWSHRPLMTRQYILRSEDQGATWELLPGPRHGGWCCLQYGRMDELRPVHLGEGRVLALARTPEGHLWELRSEDDGKTWTGPAPTCLVHPDAPPMLFPLGDGRTLAAFHHNRHSVTPAQYSGLGNNPEAFLDRSEVWVSVSTDEGRTWTEPRFVFANALAPSFENPWRNYNCSYIDALSDCGELQIFVPHRWERVLHLRLPEAFVTSLPTREELCAD